MSEGVPTVRSALSACARTAAACEESAAVTTGLAGKIRRSPTASNSSPARSSDGFWPSSVTISSSTARPFSEPSAVRAALLRPLRAGRRLGERPDGARSADGP